MHNQLLRATKRQPLFVMDNELRSPLKDLYTNREISKTRLNKNEHYKEMITNKSSFNIGLHAEFSKQGMKLVTAPAGFEAEQTCASLAEKVDGFVVSEDSDSLVFGAPVFVKGFPNNLQVVVLHEFLKELGITRDQLIDVSLMSGCDFASKIPGVGIAKAIEAVKKFGSIEMFIEHRKIVDKDYHMYSFFVESFDYQRGREVFNATLDDEIAATILGRVNRPPRLEIVSSETI
jgi:5'-3' exonuclease